MGRTKLELFTVFHLNLAYSSISEELRTELIRRCYGPMVRLARDLRIPLGFEASGFTLETAASLDPDWFQEFRSLVAEGPCEFVGSGYAQLIGPLVPAEVNSANLRLGQASYQRLLGFRPRLAFVNEQTYAAGLVTHYVDAGYGAIIMEWDNPARQHADWQPEWRYLPQYACGQDHQEIPLIWNKSVAFQKFQRFAHGELELDEYLEYLSRHVGESPRAFPLYGSDAEVFDFRPGRYQTEGVARSDEWTRIRTLLQSLKADPRFEFVRPSSVLELIGVPGAGGRLHLETPEVPVPVKKQEKYNLTRWAVTGRDNLAVNTACWRIYEALRQRPHPAEEEWRELCYLWSSDFRTHITEGRWRAYRDRLDRVEQRLAGRPVEIDDVPSDDPLPPEVTVARKGRFLTIESPLLRLKINCRRGMAIDELVFKEISDRPLCGTLAHGFYDDIALAADFYTGHLTFEMPGQPKITDLESVEPAVLYRPADSCVVLSAEIGTPLGGVLKTIRFPVGGSAIEIRYALKWSSLPVGSLRLGFVTLNPQAFEQRSLYYRTCNGGYEPETFPLVDRDVHQGASTSLLVSAQHGLGMTGGRVEFGDRETTLVVDVDRTESALLGFVTHRTVRSSYFCRLTFTGREVDENSVALASGHDANRPLIRARVVLSGRSRR